MKSKTTKYIAFTLAALSTIVLLFFVHSVAKLPDEPFWASPALIYENWTFAMLLGLGLPYPEYTGLLVLLLILGILYLVFLLFIRLALRLYTTMRT